MYQWRIQRCVCVYIYKTNYYKKKIEKKIIEMKSDRKEINRETHRKIGEDRRLVAETFERERERERVINMGNGDKWRRGLRALFCFFLVQASTVCRRVRFAQFSLGLDSGSFFLKKKKCHQYHFYILINHFYRYIFIQFFLNLLINYGKPFTNKLLYCLF